MLIYAKISGMGIFKHKKQQKEPPLAESVVAQSTMAELAAKVLNYIADGVIIIDEKNVVQMVNPAGAAMLGVANASDLTGLDISLIWKFENGQGMAITDDQNIILAAIRRAEPFKTRDYILLDSQNQKRPVEVVVTPTDNVNSEKVITFRDISKELEKEGEQTEFISTASHEMRTPVASIEGYLGLALNPQTATIDERARKYLEEAHQSSQHLGRLFQDLLDITKLDDNKMRVRLQPVEMMALVQSIADGQVPAMQAKNLRYSFGSENNLPSPERRLEQVVFSSVDVDFLREIMNNLIENAIKYTPEGGAIWVSVRGDGDRVLINVTDTGIGISPDDLKHIFQKFYRVDNSQTREIGGTGLGLYLVKERAESMGGKVWAESSFGQGTTFYVSLPRLTAEEYERRKQIMANQEAMGAPATPGMAQAQAQVQAAVAAAETVPLVVAQPAPAAAPAVAPAVAPAAPVQTAQPAAQPISQPTPQPAAQPNPAAQPAPQPAIPPAQNTSNLNISSVQ